MKITIITNYWKESNGGGVKTYVTNLVEELEKINNLKVDVLFREGLDNKNHHIPGNKLIFSLKSFLNLLKSKPDAVYTQGTWYCLFGGVIYKVLNHDVKLIHTFHTEPSTKLSFFGKNFFRCLLNRCDYVTFVSKGLMNSILETYDLDIPINKTKITYSGVNEKKVSDNEKLSFLTKYSINMNSQKILIQGFTSNDIKSEGVKLALKCIKKLKKKYPGIVFLISGDGRYISKLKEYSKLEHAEENVVFTGHLENPFVAIEICDVFLFPWLGKSGVGIALLEAMILGKSSISTVFDDQNASEVIIDKYNGLIAKPNPEDIAEKIEYLLENKELALQLGNTAKTTVKEKFTWGNTAKTYLELSKS